MLYLGNFRFFVKYWVNLNLVAKLQNETFFGSFFQHCVRTSYGRFTTTFWSTPIPDSCWNWNWCDEFGLATVTHLLKEDHEISRWFGVRTSLAYLMNQGRGLFPVSPLKTCGESPLKISSQNKRQIFSSNHNSTGLLKWFGSLLIMMMGNGFQTSQSLLFAGPMV